MLTLSVISGLAASFWALILLRRNGPWKIFYWIRWYAEEVPGLQKVIGDESGCETCLTFWLTVIGFALGYYVPVIMPLIFISAGAAIGLWASVTISVQVGQKADPSSEEAT